MVQLERKILLKDLQAYDQEDGFRPFFITYSKGIDLIGVDLVRGNPSSSSIYEEECFKNILHRRSNQFGIGSCLIDYGLTLSPLKSDVKPDAIFFKPEEGAYVLAGLYEVKSGNTNGKLRKIDGFARLVDRLREHPDAFTNLFDSLNSGITFPKVVVPQNSKIDVIFISPSSLDVQSANKYSFHIDHWVIPHSRAS